MAAHAIIFPRVWDAVFSIYELWSNAIKHGAAVSAATSAAITVPRVLVKVVYLINVAITALNAFKHVSYATKPKLRTNPVLTILKSV